MRIGITYDLRSEYLAAGYSDEETAEFDRDDTISSIADALVECGHEAVRIGNAQALVRALARGERWDLVFNICEGLKGAGREAQIPAILDVFQIPYTFSDPLLMSLCLHKGLTKTVVREGGIPTPKSFVLESLQQLSRVDLSYPLFAKPVAEGTGKGVTPASMINSPDELRATCEFLLAHFDQPVLIEEFLPGREFTVGIMGTGDAAKVIGTLEIVLLEGAEKGVYSYANKENCEVLVRYDLVQNSDPQVAASEKLALQAWKHLGCADAGRIDLRCDATGMPQFIEVNPLAGLHPSHSDLPMLCTAVGMPYVDLIRGIVDSASKRIPAKCTFRKVGN